MREAAKCPEVEISPEAFAEDAADLLIPKDATELRNACATGLFALEWHDDLTTDTSTVRLSSTAMEIGLIILRNLAKQGVTHKQLGWLGNA